MPNHCTNRIRIFPADGVSSEELAQRISGDTGAIDFEKIIPPPDNMFRGDLGQAEEEQCAREGRPTWYEWQRENWGTKWNAYSQQPPEVGESCIELCFDTAWAPPYPIINALRTRPDVSDVYGHWVVEFGEAAGVF